MKKTILVLAGMLAALAAEAAPTATVTKVETEGLSPEWVKVSYTLDADAVVTAEFFADGEKIPDGKVTRLIGDVCRKVKATGSGETRSFRWAAGAEIGADRVVKRSGSALKVKLTAWPLGNPPLYMAVSLQATNVVRYYATAAGVPGGVTNDAWKTNWLLLRHIYARNVPWMMGSPASEANRSADETLHPVLLTKDYYMGVYPVTLRQNECAKGARSSAPGTFEKKAECDVYPLNARTYNDVTEVFVPAFRGLAQIDLDLPTEAQWEFACRAGTTTPYSFGEATELATKMRYGNGNLHTGRVDEYAPNGWGLYAMHGNVTEYCRDGYVDYPTDGQTAVDPIGPVPAVTVVVRGGSYAYAASYARSAARWKTTTADGSWAAGYRLMAPAEAK